MPNRVVEILERHADVMTKAGCRMLPGFPHSVISFARGVLRLPLAGFIVVAIFGMSVQRALCASAANGVADAVAAGPVRYLHTPAPLFIFAVIVLAGTRFRTPLADRRRAWAGVDPRRGQPAG